MFDNDICVISKPRNRLWTNLSKITKRVIFLIGLETFTQLVVEQDDGAVKLSFKLYILFHVYFEINLLPIFNSIA